MLALEVAFVSEMVDMEIGLTDAHSSLVGPALEGRDYRLVDHPGKPNARIPAKDAVLAVGSARRLRAEGHRVTRMVATAQQGLDVRPRRRSQPLVGIDVQHPIAPGSVERVVARR